MSRGPGTHDRRVAGLVLAGGASQRMGRPKALLELDGRSFVVRGVELLRAGRCALVVVVDGAHPLTGVDLGGARLAHNSGWRDGPLSSLQLGLRRALALAPDLDALVVHHVEQPRVRVETLARLLSAAAEQPDCIWQPRHAARSGHPLVWPRALFEALLALDPTRASARALTRGSAASRRRWLEVEDPGVLDNVDTPAEFAALEREHGR